MACREIKELIPAYFDGELAADERQRVKSHLDSCPRCRQEARQLQSAWQLLDEIEEIRPQPDYMARFWARVAAEKQWYEKILPGIRERFFNWRLVPALAAAGAVAVLALFIMQPYFRRPEGKRAFAALQAQDLELVEHIDLAENYEVIQDIDLLSNFDIIQNLDTLEAS